MFWIISAIITPVPLIHLWLHSMLKFWRKHPFIFYAFCILMWIGTFLFFKPVDKISFFLFTPSNNLAMIGFALMSLGVLGVIGSLIALGPKRFFMWAVLRPQEMEQIRISSGPFKFIPHPAYIGYLFVALGNFLAGGKFYLALVFIFLFALTPIMIYFEEKELTQRVHE